jgi:hypothetical protein
MKVSDIQDNLDSTDPVLSKSTMVKPGIKQRAFSKLFIKLHRSDIPNAKDAKNAIIITRKDQVKKFLQEERVLPDEIDAFIVRTFIEDNDEKQELLGLKRRLQNLYMGGRYMSRRRRITKRRKTTRRRQTRRRR